MEKFSNLHTLALIAEFNRLAATHSTTSAQEEHDQYWEARKELESRILPSGALSPIYAGKHKVCPDPDGRCMFGDDENCPALLAAA